MPYRIHVWSIETGRIVQRRDYQREGLAVKRALEASTKKGIREVSVTPVDAEGIIRTRIGTACKGKWIEAQGFSNSCR